MAASAAEEESQANLEDARAKQVVEEREEPATATFASHSAGAEAVSAAESSALARKETPAELEAGPPSPQGQESSSEAAAGGEESMGKQGVGKEGKTGKGKSGWHQIRSTPASAAAPSDLFEAKQAEARAEEPLKTMAAAAAADGEAASVSAADASAIASIVDSVLADLRPRIVEEIARKLAGK